MKTKKEADEHECNEERKRDMKLGEMVRHTMLACANRESQRALMILEDQIAPKIRELEQIASNLKGEDADYLYVEQQLQRMEQILL